MIAGPVRSLFWTSQILACFQAIHTSDVAEPMDDEAILQRFIREGQLNQPPWSKEKPAHSPLYFAGMQTTEQRAALSAQITGNDANVFGRFYHKSLAAESIDRIKSITERDVSQCTSDECCKFISDVFDHLRDEVLPGLSPVCLRRLALDAIHSLRGTKLLARIPENLLQDNAKHIIKELKGRLVSVDLPVLKQLLTRPEACRQIGRLDWQGLLIKKETGEIISSACLRAGAVNLLHLSPDSPANASVMNANVFAEFHRALAPPLAGSMRKEQMQEYAAALQDGEMPASDLPLDQLSVEAASGLTLRHLLGYLYAEPNRSLKIRRGIWDHVPETIFDELAEEDASIIAQAIKIENSNDLSKAVQTFMKPGQINTLAKYPVICSKFDPSSMSSKIVLNRECFSSMSHLTQAAAFVMGAQLPEDILSTVTSRQLAGWKFGPTRGIRVIMLAIGRRPNLHIMIRHLGAKVSFNHPCNLIRNLKMLEEMQFFQSHMTLKCISNLGFTLNAADYAQLQPRLSYLKPFSILKQEKSVTFWRNMDPEVMGWLIHGSNFCAGVDQETITILNRDVFNMFDAECVMHMLHVIKAFPDDAVGALSPASLTRLMASHLNAKFMSLLSPAQLEKIGTEAEGEAGSIASLIDLAILKAYSEDHLKVLTKDHWRFVTPDAFAAIDSQSRLVAIPADATVYWTYAQVSKIPTDVIVKMTVEQAHQIGRLTKKSECPLKLFLKLHFPKEVQNVIDQRLKKAGIELPASKTLTFILIITGAFAVLSIVGVALFFWFKNRN